MREETNEVKIARICTLRMEAKRLLSSDTGILGRGQERLTRKFATTKDELCRALNSDFDNDEIALELAEDLVFSGSRLKKLEKIAVQILREGII